MWTSVVDTKQGKVWANLPTDSKMMLVADVEDNAADYLMWNKMIGSIRDSYLIGFFVILLIISKSLNDLNLITLFTD